MNKKHNQDRDLVIRYQSGDEQALEELTEIFYPCIVFTAQKTAKASGNHVQYGDLIGSAFEGLKQAAERFDTNGATTFSGFASYRMSGACKDQVRAESKTARTNVIAAGKLEKHRQRIEQHFCRRLTDFEALEIMGFDMRWLDSIKLTNGISLDYSVDDTPTFAQTISKEDDPSLLERRDFFITVAKIAAEKTEAPSINFDKCAQLLLLYYGDGLTMGEAGQEMNLSESRFSQVHQSIIEVLKTQGELLEKLSGRSI